MKKLITCLAALAVSVSFATAADAEKKGASPEERFKKMDTNGDGSISMDEFKSSPMAKKTPDKADEMFKKKDKDGDGKLSMAEFNAGGKKPAATAEATAPKTPAETGNAGKAATTTTATDGGKSSAAKPANTK